MLLVVESKNRSTMTYIIIRNTNQLQLVISNDFRYTINVSAPYTWGRLVSTGKRLAEVASRGAVGLVKSGKNINANTNYALAA